MIDLITKQTITTAVDIHRSIPHVVYCGYEITIVLRNIKDIAFYWIGRTRVTRLCVYVYNRVCVGGEVLCHK